MQWIEIDAEIIRETEKALLLVFTNGMSAKQIEKWFPRSVYIEEIRGNFRIQKVKKWFIVNNNLWNLLN